MRILKYDEMLKTDYDEIRNITSSGHPFTLVTDVSLTAHIQKILANENDFRGSARTLIDRWRYIVGSFHGFRLLNLMPIWNRAVMDGYKARAVKNGSLCEVIFEKI